MNKLTQRQWADMLLKLGKRRLEKVADAGFEYRGFDIVLKEGLENEHGTTMRYFDFDEYATKTELVEDMKAFIDNTTIIEDIN